MAIDLASAHPVRLDAGFASGRRMQLSIERIFAEPAGLLHTAGTGSDSGGAHSRLRRRDAGRLIT